MGYEKDGLPKEFYIQDRVVKYKGRVDIKKWYS